MDYDIEEIRHLKRDTFSNPRMKTTASNRRVWEGSLLLKKGFLRKLMGRQKVSARNKMNQTYHKEMYYSPNIQVGDQPKNYYMNYETKINVSKDEWSSEHIKSIASLHKRRQILNCQYSDSNNETPLMLFLKNFKQQESKDPRYMADIVDFMIKNGADIRILNRYQQNIYHYVAQYGNIEVLKIIRAKDKHLRKCGVNAQTSHFTGIDTDHWTTTFYKQINSVKSLGSFRSDPPSTRQTNSFVNKEDEHRAIYPFESRNYQKGVTITKKLKNELHHLEYQVDVNGHTPLHLAVISRVTPNSTDSCEEGLKFLKVISKNSPAHFLLDMSDKLPIEYAEGTNLFKTIEKHVQGVKQIYLADRDKKPTVYDTFYKDIENSGFSVNGLKFSEPEQEKCLFIKKMDEFLKRQ